MHSGVWRGFRALVTMVPRLKLGFVVLTNLGGINGMYLGLPKVRDWNAHMLDVLETNEEREAAE